MLNNNKKINLALENLEDRVVPAFDLMYTPYTDLWTITQVANDGAVTVSVDGGNFLTVSDASGTANAGIANGSLTLNMLSGTGDVSVTLDGFLSGNVMLNLNNGDRFLTFDGGANAINGNLTIRAGTGDQSVELGLNSPLSVGGTSFIDLGTGVDETFTTTGLFNGGNFTARGVNFFDDTDIGLPMFIGGSMSFYSNMEAEDTIIALDFADWNIGSNLTILSGNGDEIFFINDGTIGGNLYMNAGNSLAFGIQDMDISGTTIGGNVTVLAGFSSFVDNLVMDGLTTIGGNVYVNLGSGDNGVIFDGTLGGTSVTYIGGSGLDDVFYNFSGGLERIYANLGAGDDTFSLQSTVAPAYLYVDFGIGTDFFDNQFPGVFTFPVILRNLP